MHKVHAWMSCPGSRSESVCGSDRQPPNSGLPTHRHSKIPDQLPVSRTDVREAWSLSLLGQVLSSQGLVIASANELLVSFISQDPFTSDLTGLLLLRETPTGCLVYSQHQGVFLACPARRR